MRGTGEQLKFSPKFERVGEKIRASFIVRFPAAMQIRPRHGAALHPDLKSAEAWVKNEAKRRGIDWEPDN